jgi:hypothetical protein
MSTIFNDEAVWNYIVKSAATSVSLEPAERSVCPSLPRFLEGMRNGWAPEDRAHVSSCAACQTTMSLAWRLECPSIWILIQHLAFGDRFEDAQAVQLHLRERDCCRQCKLTLRSSFVRAAAKLLSVNVRLSSKIQALADQAACLFFRAPDWALSNASEPPSVFTSGGYSETVGLTLIDTHGQLTFRVLATPESAVQQAEIVAAERHSPLPLSWEDDRGLRRAQRQIAKDLVPPSEECLLLVAPRLPQKEIVG